MSFQRIRLTGIILLEVGIIVWCIFLIYRAVSERAKQQSYVTALSSMDYKRIPTATLQYYYEIEPGSDIEEVPPWGGPAVTRHINTQGQNDGIDRGVDKPANVYRIIALGDSFTFGQYVPTDRNYPSRLQETLQKSLVCGKTPEVINFGVPGYDVQYAVEHFKAHGTQYKPDLVVWFLKDDDFSDIQEFTWIEKGIIENEASASGKTSEYVEKKGIYFQDVMAVEKLHATYTDAEILALQREYLDRFIQVYQGNLVIFTYQTTKPEYKEILRKFVEGRPYTWLSDNLNYVATPEQRFPDGHPTAIGYEHIVSDMTEFLRSSSVFPCDK